MYEWKAEYNTGVAEIDSQHQNLFRILRELNESFKDKTSKEKSIKCVEYLDHYIKMHFSFEEGCMYASKCPAAQKNKTQHAEFLKDYALLREKLTKDDYSEEAAKDLAMMISKWFIKHILSVDVQLNSCMH